jgi:hypothetical protein
VRELISIAPLKNVPLQRIVDLEVTVRRLGTPSVRDMVTAAMIGGDRQSTRGRPGTLTAAGIPTGARPSLTAYFPAGNRGGTV